jgi:tetratricopeptide (TPR) repeat protein
MRWNSGRVWTSLGRAQRLSGQHRQGLRSLRQATRIAPASARAWDELARLHFARNEPDRAEPALRQALAHNDTSAWSWAVLGSLQVNTGRGEAAESSLLRSLHLDPASAWAWRRLGDAYNDRLQNQRRAVEAFTRAVELAPGDYWAWANLGNAQKNAGCLDEALTSLRRAMLLDSRRGFAWWRLGEIHVLQGRPCAALAAFRRGLSGDTAYTQLEGALRDLQADALQCALP